MDSAGDSICGIRKSGQGGLDPAALYEILDTAKEVARNLRPKVDAFLLRDDPETELASFVNKIGFFAK